jgi:hypothetical protein
MPQTLKEELKKIIQKLENRNQYQYARVDYYDGEPLRYELLFCRKTKLFHKIITILKSLELNDDNIDRWDVEDGDDGNYTKGINNKDYNISSIFIDFNYF